MIKQLRPYQQRAVKDSLTALSKNNEPVLLNSCVGSGKSVMLSEILLQSNRALCIVNNSELVRNNCETFNLQGGKGGIYCAALGEKDCTSPVIFGTPQSVVNGLDKELGDIKFDLIVVDEAHGIAFHEPNSLFMRILNHYKVINKALRVLGATGTPFRFKGSKIVGDGCLFKTQTGDITIPYLIDLGFLTKPTFEVDQSLTIDFTKVKIKSNGQFDTKQLQEVVDNNTRLTKTICEALVHIMEHQNRFGVFVFATTKAHAKEILSYLPAHESALVLGETKVKERTQIFNDARVRKIKYVVNISIVSVGIDIPAYDTIAYLRPTESLVLMTQTMGRALRLAPNKYTSLVLDFAGNIERHRDWDNPLLLDALKQTIDKDKTYDIICPACQVLNTSSSRRCVGNINDKRCEYFFEWQECPNKACKASNDISSRHCRLCKTEIIDPNDKLSLHVLTNGREDLAVMEAKYGVSGSVNNFQVHAAYLCVDIENKQRWIYEKFMPAASEKSKNYFYGNFVKHCCKKAYKYYPKLNDKETVVKMLNDIDSPIKLHVKNDEIKKRIFLDR